MSLLALATALVIAGPSALASPAAAIQPLESITAAAAARLQDEADRAWSHEPAARVAVSVGRLDTRLRLPECSQALATELPPGARPLGAVAVGVRCPLPSWSLYVPGRIEVSRPVVVTATSLARGATLSRADLVLEHRDLSTLPAGYVSDPAELVGTELRRALQPGAVLLPGMSAAPRLVDRGDRVILQASGGTIAVQVEGEALGSGALGDRVQVRNLATRRVVEGIVTGSGTVAVNLPNLPAAAGRP